MAEYCHENYPENIIVKEIENAVKFGHNMVHAFDDDEFDDEET